MYGNIINMQKQFMNDADQALARMGAEIILQEQVIKAQQEQIDRLKQLLKDSENKEMEKDNGQG